MLSSIDIPTKGFVSNELILNENIGIVSLNANNLEYDNFFTNFMSQNIPCLISNISTTWNCSKYWINDNNEINYEYIVDKYGNIDVPVANCSEQFYNAQKKIEMKLCEYLKYYAEQVSSVGHNELQLLYLKDWHFRKAMPAGDIYDVPKYFASDWLNEYSLDNDEDDYMFVYMGPGGTWTPFHADVFSSFSWSVNVSGRKRWVLFPPDTEKALVDNLGNLPYDITHNEKVVSGNVKYYDFFQNPGEALFVPSRWHHQVWNVKGTLSINHNWVNGCNIKTVWESMQRSLSEIKLEISDCLDMESFNEHCQLMLNAMFGMDFIKFFKFLCHVSLKRIDKLLNKKCILLFNTFVLEEEHCKFDLNCILSVLEEFVKNEDYIALDWSQQEIPPEILINKIKEVLL